jgi:hypothetical protein
MSAALRGAGAAHGRGITATDLAARRPQRLGADWGS